MTTSNPFPGLRPFEANENHLFFGRDGQSDEILTSLRRNRFVAVVGTSGSGKSSLIRAGLLPSLHGGLMAKTSSSWHTVVFRPGSDPIDNLAKALSAQSVLGTETDDTETQTVIMEMTLRRSALGLIEAVRQARMSRRTNLLIVVDQFEELFRFRSAANAEASEDDATFVKLLIEATRQTDVPIYVVITMRSDFIGDCARFRELPETINRGLYLIPLMTRDQRREAITGPAAVAGTTVSPPLINRLLNDVGDNPDQLPILQHALMRTWGDWDSHHKDGESIDLRHYEKIGTLTKALSKHADEAYDELPNQRSKVVAEKVFKALAEMRSDNREVRRPTKVSELCAIAGASEEEVIAVIGNFRRPGRSFVTPAVGIPLDSDSIIDISHESLIRGWQRLKDWVDGEALSAAIYRRLADTAVLYREGKAGLWRDPDLQVAVGWFDKTNPNKEWGVRYHPEFPAAMSFLADSKAARDSSLVETERRRVNNLRRTQIFATVLTLLLILASALAAFAVAAKEDAVKQAQVAETLRAAAVREQQRADQARQDADIAREKETQAKQEAEDSAGRARDAELKALRLAALARRKENEARASLQVAEEQRMAAEQRKQDFQRAVARERNENQVDKRTIDWLAGELASLSSPYEAVQWRTVKAGALTDLGLHKDAEEQLSQVLAIEPDYPDGLMTRGYMYMLNDKVKESIADFDRIINKIDPQSSLAYLNKGISEGILGGRQGYQEASSSVNKAIQYFMPGTYDSLSENEVSPDIFRATGYPKIVADEKAFRTALYYQLANIQAFEGSAGFEAGLKEADKHSGSFSAYLTALNWSWLHMNKRSNDYGALVSQGALWERLGINYCDEATRTYDRFQLIHKKSRDQRYDGLAQWAAKRRAKLQCPTFRSGTPDAQALASEAKILTWYGKFDKAHELLTTAIGQESESENIDLLLQRSELRNRMGDFPASKDDAESVIKISGATPVPKAYLLRAYASDVVHREADFRTVLKYSPTNIEALISLSALIEERDPKEARSLLDTSIKVRPFDPDLYFRNANLLNGQEHYDEALHSIEIAIAIRNDEVAYYDVRARAQCRVKDLTECKNAEVMRERAVGYRETGDALLRRGDAGRALDKYVKSLELLAPIMKEANNENIRSTMVWTMRKISRLIEQKGSRAEAIQYLKSKFGDVKGLEAVLNDEITRLSKSP